MQHRGPRSVIRRCRMFSGSMAALVAGWGCADDLRTTEPTSGGSRDSSPVESVLDPFDVGEAAAPAKVPPTGSSPSLRRASLPSTPAQGRLPRA